MRASQAMADVNMEQSRAHVRRTPLCYSRQAPRDGIDQADLGESSTMLAICSVMTCTAAAFLVVYGSWGL